MVGRARSAATSRATFYDVERLQGRARTRCGRSSSTRSATSPGARWCTSQCHFGLDTLSWARLGARASPGSTSRRRRWRPPAPLAAERGARRGASWPRRSTTLRQALGGRRFDLVYTGIGALNWLPDLEPLGGGRPPACSRRAASCYLSEFHPIAWTSSRRRRPRRSSATTSQQRAARLRRPGDLRGPRARPSQPHRGVAAPARRGRPAGRTRGSADLLHDDELTVTRRAWLLAEPGQAAPSMPELGSLPR